MSLHHRLMSKVEVQPNGCWFWTGYRDSNGYGRISTWPRTGRLAHRVSFEHFIGIIPHGFVLDHECDNPPCINPFHLRVTTHRVNVMRGASLPAQNGRKTHCPKGHRYDDVRKNGWRRCSTCDKEAERRRTDRRSAERRARREARAAA